MRVRDLNVAETKGRRPSMQDVIGVNTSVDGAFFLGVFDGHGVYGAEIALEASSVVDDVDARYGNLRSAGQKVLQVARNLSDIHNTILQSGNMFHQRGGSTATVAVFKNNELAVSYLGDSEAFYYTDEGQIIPLIQPHTVNNHAEVIRVKNLGDYFIDSEYFGEEVLIDGEPGLSQLAISRSVGDPEGFVSGDSDITKRKLRSPGTLVVASDGVWGDEITHDIVHRVVRGRKGSEKISELALDLVELCAPRAEDNASAIVARIE